MWQVVKAIIILPKKTLILKPYYVHLDKKNLIYYDKFENDLMNAINFLEFKKEEI